MNEPNPAEDRTREAVVEHTTVGRALALSSVGLWLVTLLLLASHAGAHGF